MFLTVLELTACIAVQVCLGFAAIKYSRGELRRHKWPNKRRQVNKWKWLSAFFALSFIFYTYLARIVNTGSLGSPLIYKIVDLVAITLPAFVCLGLELALIEKHRPYREMFKVVNAPLPEKLVKLRLR